MYLIMIYIRNVDKATGFHTRNILCQPIRMNQGSGPVIAVLQMLNKANGQSFDEQDNDILSRYCNKISDELNNRFSELLQAAEVFHSEGDIMDGGNGSNRRRRYDQTTLSSQIRRNSLILQQSATKSKFDSDTHPYYSNYTYPLHENITRSITRRPRPSDALISPPHSLPPIQSTVGRSTSLPTEKHNDVREIKPLGAAKILAPIVHSSSDVDVTLLSTSSVCVNTSNSFTELMKC